MLTWISKRVWLATMVIALGSMCVSAVRAADEVDNPQYGAWARFNVGSSASIAADMKIGPNQVDVHMEMTRTLESVTSDEVVLEIATKSVVMGHETTSPPRKQTIKAKAPAYELKDMGSQDVEAMGKTFKCHVYELTGDAAHSTAPKAGPGAQGTADAKATIYSDREVPGGVVKMEATGANGNTMTFILTAMNVK